MPHVESLNLSHNRLTDINCLQFLSTLTQLDVSYNTIRRLDALHTRLGNITDLCLANNKLETLAGR